MVEDNNDDGAVPDDGDPNYIDEPDEPVAEIPGPSFENVLDLQARFNTPDCQVALWWNMVSLDQGITDYQRLTCGSSVAAERMKQVEKTISSHIQENIGFPDMDYDGKKSRTAVGRNRTDVIDHYTCTSGGKYLDNFSLPNPKKVKVNGKWVKEKIQAGLIIAIQLHEILKKFLARASLVFLGADSTATNTGWKNGAIGKKYALK